MTDAQLIIECGAAQTRATLMEGDDVRAFWFGPARGDETLPRPPDLGDIHVARIRKLTKGAQGAFVDIGWSRDGFLSYGHDRLPPVEGERLVVKVKRPPMGQKGPLVTGRWRAGLAANEVLSIEAAAAGGEPRRLNEREDAAVSAFRSFSAEKIVRATIDDAEAARALAIADSVRLTVGMGYDQSRRLSECVAASFERTVTIDDGVRLTFDETEALTAIDINSAKAADGRSAPVNDKVNVAAANALFGELSRRGIGGRIVVDFLAFPHARSRETFKKTLARAKHGYNCRFGALASDGLFDLTAPRTGLSLLERATEFDRTTPRPGPALYPRLERKSCDPGARDAAEIPAQSQTKASCLFGSRRLCGSFAA